MRKLRGEEGQTLIEILLAFGVAILVLGAIVVGATTSLSNTQYTKNQGLATSYAQEGLAIVKKIRNSSWSDFLLKTDVNYCLDQSSTNLTSPELNCGQNVGIFRRAVKLIHDSPDCSNGSIRGSELTVTVSWSDNKCSVGTPFCHKIELVTCLSNIDQKLSP